MAKKHLEVVVASTSEQKLGSTRLVFRSGLFRRKYEVTVRGVKAASDINAQPIGDSETELGARNRLTHAQELAPSADIWLAIENGVRDVTTRRGIRHEDFAIVVVQDKQHHEGIAKSKAVEFPDNAYQEAKRRGFETTTVGSVIAEMTGWDGTDPHFYLTHGKKPRKKLLATTIRKAIRQLPL